MDYYGGNGRDIDKFPTALPYSTSVSIDPELDFDLSGVSSSKPLLSGPIHPFHKRKNNLYDRSRTTLRHLLQSSESRKTFFLIFLDVTAIALVKTWSSSLNSIALDGLTLMIVFDLMTLLLNSVKLVTSSSCVTSSTASSSMMNSDVVGERRQMLLIFASLIFTMVGAIFIYKQSIIRALDQPVVIVENLLPSTFLLLGCNFIKMALVRINPLHSLCQASQSSLIQEHLSDMSTGLCHSLPWLSVLLLPRINPILVVTCLSTFLITTSHLLIQIESFYLADTVASTLIATLILCSLWPLATSSGRILLNSLPAYVVAQLDKLLSEAQTLDGVLEIRNEKFYAIGLGEMTSSVLRHNNNDNSKGEEGGGLMMCGSVQVRVRRDADPQMVLAHVTNKLAPLVHHLTIQVVKDEWAKTSLHHHHHQISPHQAMSVATTATRKNHHHHISSGSTKTSSKPIAAIAPYKPTNQTARTNDNAFAFASPLATATTPSRSPKAGDGIARMYRNAFPLGGVAELNRWKK